MAANLKALTCKKDFFLGITGKTFKTSTRDNKLR